MAHSSREIERRMRQLKPPTAKCTGGALNGRSVYILEPHAGTRQNLVDALSQAGCNTEAFESLDLLLGRLHGQYPDCVLADASPPDSLGLRLLSLLPADGRPPIVLTAFGSEVTDAVHAMRAGATDFLEKPLVHSALLVRLGRAMRIQGTH